MKLQALFATVALPFALIQAQYPDPWRINEYEIEPFPQPKPTTFSEKAAIRHKPQLMGCVPFPAVSKSGQIGTGRPTNTYVCKKNPNGAPSQVYARSRWVYGQWAIMYGYYMLTEPGSLSAWQSVVVFIDNPAVENSTVVSCALSNPNGEYTKYEPCNSVDGPSVRLQFFHLGNFLRLIDAAGDSQHELVMWEGLTDIARLALNDTTAYPNVPMNDVRFVESLEKAYNNTYPQQ